MLNAPIAEEPHPSTEQVTTVPPELQQVRRTSLAAERTWLAWWRTALAASAGALGVGRLAPELLNVAAWPYIVLGTCYGLLAIALLLAGAARQREVERVHQEGGHAPLRFRTVALFTGGGVVLAVTTVVLVLIQG